MLIEIWITLIAISFLLIFLGLYENNFFTSPNYILLFLGFSFIFLLGIELFQEDVQVPTGWNATTTGWDVVRSGFGSFDIGFFVAIIGFIGAVLTIFHYKTPKIMQGVVK